MTHAALLALCVTALTTASASATTVIHVDQDYMTSGFFQSGPFIRGDEANSGRGTKRVSTENVDVAGPAAMPETTYFAFDFDPSQFAGPIDSAIFRVQTLIDPASFGLDPTDANRFDVSVHSLSADPMAAIDPALASGAGSWNDFRTSQITTASIISTISVGDAGIYDWDITSLVNEWIANGDTNSAYVIGTSGLLDDDDNTILLGFANASSATLSPDVVTARIIVPAPGAFGLVVGAGLLGLRRRRA